MLILLDGVSRVYNIIYTEDTNCSHIRWLHSFHDTFSQRKDGDKLGSILILYSCSQPSQAQITALVGFVTLGMSECWLMNMLCSSLLLWGIWEPERESGRVL